MTATTTHIFLDKQHPAVWRALNGLGLKVKEAAHEAGMEPRTMELLHVRDAVKAGETPQRLAVLPAWRDTSLFTDKERAALALAESITELPGHRSQEQEEAFAREHLTEEEFSVVSWLAIAMNAFNRVSITSHHPVRKER